jgi:hypothetical protein
MGIASRNRLSEIDPSVSAAAERTGLTALIRASTKTPAHDSHSPGKTLPVDDTCVGRRRLQLGLHLRCVAAGDYLIDKTVFDSLLRAQKIIAVGVFFNFFYVLTSMMREDLIEHLAQA